MVVLAQQTGAWYLDPTGAIVLSLVGWEGEKRVPLH